MSDSIINKLIINALEYYKRNLFSKWSLAMIKRAFLIIVLIVLMYSLTGCQTIAGVGADIKWSAEAAAELMEGVE